MATSKTLTPTNVTIQIPAFTDQPDQRVNSNCIDKEADAINALNSKIASIDVGTYTVAVIGVVDGGYVRYVHQFSRKDNPTRNVTINSYQISGGSQVTSVSDVNVEVYASYLMIYSNNSSLISNASKRPVVFNITVS